MKVKSQSEVAQLCLTLCNPTDCSLPGSSVCGIFQARVLEGVAIAFSQEGDDMCIIKMNCIVVWQKTTHYKAIFFQLKNKKIKDKNMILTDAFDKIQHLKKVCAEGTYLNIIKGHIRETHS